MGIDTSSEILTIIIIISLIYSGKKGLMRLDYPKEISPNNLLKEQTESTLVR